MCTIHFEEYYSCPSLIDSFQLYASERVLFDEFLTLKSALVTEFTILFSKVKENIFNTESQHDRRFILKVEYLKTEPCIRYTNHHYFKQVAWNSVFICQPGSRKFAQKTARSHSLWWKSAHEFFYGIRYICSSDQKFVQKDNVFVCLENRSLYPSMATHLMSPLELILIWHCQDLTIIVLNHEWWERTKLNLWAYRYIMALSIVYSGALQLFVVYQVCFFPTNNPMQVLFRFVPRRTAKHTHTPVLRASFFVHFLLFSLHFPISKWIYSDWHNAMIVATFLFSFNCILN